MLFTGKEPDPDTTLYYSNARWYDSSLGRFITEDPIKDGLNWYGYCGGNPLVFVDPSGFAYGRNKYYKKLARYSAEGVKGKTLLDLASGKARRLTEEEISKMIEVIGTTYLGTDIPYEKIVLYERAPTVDDMKAINESEKVGIPDSIILGQKYEPNRAKSLPGYNIFIPPGNGDAITLHEIIHAMQYMKLGNLGAIQELMAEQAEYDAWRAAGKQSNDKRYVYDYELNNKKGSGLITKLTDIETLEGQAKFIQDFYEKYFKEKNNKKFQAKTIAMAAALKNDGFSSTAISAVLY